MRLRDALLTLLLASGCSPSTGGQPVRDDHASPPPPPASPAPGDSFAVALLARHARDEPGSANVLLSPTSVAVAMRLVTEGAVGRTRDSLAAMLGFAAMPEPAMRERTRERLDALRAQQDVALDIGTALWVREGIALGEGFRRRAREWYDAEAESLDLGDREAVRRIDAWASRATQGRIPRVLADTPSSDVVAIVTQAVYFKGTWQDRFDDGATRPKPFRRPAGAVDVPTMHRVGFHAYHEAAGVRVARLPYRGNRFAMYVLLPDSAHGVDDAVRALTPELLAAAAASPGRELAVALPRFTLRYSTQLLPTLRRIGARAAFAPGADFSAMFAVPPERSWLSRVQQDVFVEVNEEGTEAAAVTTVDVSADTASMPLGFVVDHPFVFAIRDDLTGELLFTGRVVDPTAK